MGDHYSMAVWLLRHSWVMFRDSLNVSSSKWFGGQISWRSTSGKLSDKALVSPVWNVLFKKKEAHLKIMLQHCAFQCHIFVLPCISRTILFCSVYFDSMSCSIYSCCWFSVVLLCVVFFIVYHEEGGLFVLSLICIYATQRSPAIGGTKSATNKQCSVD